MRFAILVAAFGAVCLAAPASAAPIFLQFDVTASGPHVALFRVPVGQEPANATCGNNGSPFSDCSRITTDSRVFSFAQNFDFAGGVATYSSGLPYTTGVTSFTLTQQGGNLLLSGFNYSFNNVLAGSPIGDTINLTAPNQVLGVPEPATWAMMLIGFGALGANLRRRARPAFA